MTTLPQISIARIASGKKSIHFSNIGDAISPPYLGNNTYSVML
jgi:hypothetical protein